MDITLVGSYHTTMGLSFIRPLGMLTDLVGKMDMAVFYVEHALSCWIFCAHHTLTIDND